MVFNNELIDNKKTVDAELNALLGSIQNKNLFLDKTYKNIQQSLLYGGKRLRPLLLIKTFEQFSAKNDDILKTALSVELLHASTLIQDDVMDEDYVRRNNPAFHKLMKDLYLESHKDKLSSFFIDESSRFGASTAICAGNILYTLGLSCLINSSFDFELVKKAINEYNNAYRTINEGQILDLFSEHENIKEKDYIDISNRKTSALFQAAVKIGAILAGKYNEQLTLLSNYAKFVAIAFQLQDDILDITGQKGNSLGSDIKEGKRTLLYIKALELCNAVQTQHLFRIFGNNNAAEADIKQAIKIISETSLPYAQKLAASYLNAAKEEIQKCDLKDKQFFLDFADYCVKRSN